MEDIMLTNLDNEVIFKKAFTDKTVFTCFVKDILGIDFVVNKIETEKKFSPKVGNIDFAYDIFAESADHRIIVEIQRVDYDYGFDRFLHYHLMALAELQKSSSDYQINKQVYTIVMLSAPYKINNLRGIPVEDEVLISEVDPRNLDDKKSEIFPHKLVYLNPNYKSGKTPANYRDWLDLIYESIHHPENYKLNEKNKGIKRAVDLINYDHLSGSELEKMKISESRKKMIAIVENDAIKKERINQEQKQILKAKKMLEDGLSIEQIIDYTDLTKEDINKLK